MEIILLPASKLRRRLGARKVSEGKLSGLVESIRELGIISPLRVRPISVYENGRPGEGWEITAGCHRFEAASRLNMTELPCIVVQDSDLHAELAMIDENLCRAELTPAEAALQTARRKEIYEVLHPEAKAQVRQGLIRQGAADDNLSPAFTEATANATGKDQRAIQRDAARGEALGDDLEAIAGTSLDKGVELDALAKLPEPERRHIIQRAVAGEEVSARLKVDDDVKSDAAKQFAARLAERFKPEEWDWVKSSLYTSGAKLIADAFVNETGSGPPIMDRRYGT